MTSTTVRHPVKAKSLTLLELCQTINELQNTSSRNTAQILTRRLYLHPLSVSNTSKQHTSKIITNNLLQIEEPNEIITPSPRNPPYRGLAILSSSFPLIARTNVKTTNQSLNVEHDVPSESEGSVTTFGTSLPLIPRNPTSLSSSSRRTTTSTRSSFIAIQRKSKSTPPPPAPLEKIDVWRHLALTLQRPPPRDPPTTPLDTHSHEILPLPNCIHIPTCDSPIEETD